VAWCAAVDERENVQLGGGFKPNITGVTDVFGRCKAVRQNDLADLVIKREVETTYVEIDVRERFTANSVFELKRLPSFRSPFTTLLAPVGTNSP
jgi:hypothetical protein